MARKFNLISKNMNSKLGQKGAVLIFLAFILGLGAAAYLLKTFNADNVKAKQDEKTYQTLKNAKQALIAWAVSHPITPGQLPLPDRNSGGGFDGNSDCYTGVFSYSFLIGQLPILGQTAPCVLPRTGLGGDWRDAQGNRLWYAVSRNLVHEYQSPSFDPAINPSLINKTSDWIHVVDRNGNLISDKVAAVIIAPGAPVGNQDRSLQTADQYLEKIVRVSDNKPFKNYGYPINPFDDNEFIIGEDGRNVGSADNIFKKPYYFNDKLVFITIDELINAIGMRAALVAKTLLNSYKVKNANFPDADLLGSTSYSSVIGNKSGMLPIDITNVCACSSSNSCSCSFGLISNVSFKRSSGTWSATNISGSCARATSTTCMCTGVGYCKNTAGSTNFTCDASGLCTNNAVRSYTYMTQDFEDVFVASTGCTKSSSNTVVCNGNGNFSLGLNEPSWFKINLWQDYFYYKWSSTSDLQLGDKSNLNAILINSGYNLSVSEVGWSQNPPSSDIRDYLDSNENTNNDHTFDATNKQKTSKYNDQSLIVSP